METAAEIKATVTGLNIKGMNADEEKEFWELVRGDYWERVGRELQQNAWAAENERGIGKGQETRAIWKIQFEEIEHSPVFFEEHIQKEQEQANFGWAFGPEKNDWWEG